MQLRDVSRLQYTSKPTEAQSSTTIFWWEQSETYPLPRIDDLLDQLGNARFFSTLDLAAGYWQICMAPEAQEKTVFVTHQGLYEFEVMPLGLTNAPAAFQRLMQQILLPLNPKHAAEFVNVYVDEVIVFSSSLEDQLEHLRQVVCKIMEAGLKLKPSKCHFARAEVEYLHGVPGDPGRTEANHATCQSSGGIPCFHLPEGAAPILGIGFILQEIYPSVCQDSPSAASSYA